VKWNAVQFVGRRDIAQDTVQPDVVVMVHVERDTSSRFLQLAVGLRVVRTGPDAGDAGQPDEQLEVFGDELRTIIADDPWFRVGMVLQH